MNSRFTLAVGALFGFLAVALGAFGAHVLNPLLTENGWSATYDLATRYMFYHALALLFVGLFNRGHEHKLLRYSAVAFSWGIILFSGSLMLLSILDAPKIGMVTPVGGLFLLAGWITMLVSFVRQK